MEKEKDEKGEKGVAVEVEARVEAMVDAGGGAGAEAGVLPAKAQTEEATVNPEGGIRAVPLALTQPKEGPPTAVNVPDITEQQSLPERTLALQPPGGCKTVRWNLPFGSTLQQAMDMNEHKWGRLPPTRACASATTSG